MNKIEIGDAFTFIPSWLQANHNGAMLQFKLPEAQMAVTGTVDYINRKNRWFRVRYRTPVGNLLQHESFPLPAAEEELPHKHGYHFRGQPPRKTMN